MKKSLSVLAGGLVLAFAMNSCNSENSAEQMAKDNAKIDSLVNVRLTVLRDSMNTECNKMAMGAAQMKADSMIAAMSKKKGIVKKTPVKPVPPTPTNTKDSKMSGDQTKDTKSKDDKMSGEQTKDTKSKDAKMNKNNPPK